MSNPVLLLRLLLCFIFLLSLISILVFFINLFISINHDNGSGASIRDYENDASVMVLFLSVSAEIN